MKKKIIGNVLMTLSAATIILCLLIIFGGKNRNNEEQELLSKLGMMTQTYAIIEHIDSDSSGTEAGSKESTGIVTEQTAEPASEAVTNEHENIQIDFAALKLENKDICAWIRVPGTCVDYPVLTSDEDNYYLRRGIDGGDSQYGSIYYNKSCTPNPFLYFNTILYGHNREDDIMFASLHRFDNEDFFLQNDKIYIYTESFLFEYIIYACVKHDDSYLPSLYQFDTLEGRRAFLDMIENPMESEVNHVREGVNADEWSKFITLSTCMDVNVNRFLVIGVLDRVIPK